MKTRLFVAALAVGLVSTGCGSNPAAPGKEPAVKVTVVKLQPSVGATVGVSQPTSLVVRVEYDLGYSGALAELLFHNAKNPSIQHFGVKNGRKQLPFTESGVVELSYDLVPGAAYYGVLEGETVDFMLIQFVKGIDYPGTSGTLVFSERIPLNWRFVR